MFKTPKMDERLSPDPYTQLYVRLCSQGIEPNEVLKIVESVEIVVKKVMSHEIEIDESNFISLAERI